MVKILARVDVSPRVAVAPLSANISRSRQLRGSVVRFLIALFRWIHNVLDRLPGQCTVSKLDAFVTFQQETSPQKIAAILLLTPLPCLIINLLIECIPLNDPTEGFWASGAFQLRLFWSGFIACLMPFLKKLDCVPESPISSPQMLTLFAVTQACIGLITNGIISLAADVFPVPLSQFTPIVPMSIAGRLLFYRHVPNDPQLHAQSNKVNIWLSVEVLPILIYPAFTIAFMQLTSSEQFWVSFVFPLLRIGIRRVFWLITKDDHDLIAVNTCCVGHLYHALFTAMILQNSKSLKTMGVVFCLGASKMLLNCYYVLRDSKELQAAKATLKDVHCSSDYFSTTLQIVDESVIAKALHQQVPSLFLSTYPRYRTHNFMAKHEGILKLASPIRNKWLKLRSIVAWSEVQQRTRQATIHVARESSRPSTLNSIRSKSTTTTSEVAPREVHSTLKQEQFVKKFAFTVHQNQIILVKSYVSICMDLFYVIYLVAVFWSPNRPYFPTQDAMTSVDAVQSAIVRLLVICGMEVVFFAIYLALMRKHFGISGIYQLAFVLWSQRVLVQAQFIQLTISILAFPLTHFGNDVLLPLKRGG